MFDYRLKRIVQEEGADTVAYVEILDGKDGTVIRTVCVPYKSEEEFLDALRKKVRRVQEETSQRLSVEQKIKNVLIANKASIEQEGEKS